MKKEPLLLSTIILVFVIAKLPFLFHRVLWDEAVYLGMGKFIYSHGASGLWEMIRPLGLPVVTGLWWALGFHQIVVSRIVSLLFSAGILCITYLLAKELFDGRTGLIAAFLLAITPVFYFYGEYIMTDHVSALLLYAAIYFIMRKKYALAGVCGGLAFFFKFTHSLFLIGALFYIAYMYFVKREKRVAWLAVAFVFVAAYFVINVALYHTHYAPTDAALKPYFDAAAYQNNPYQNVPTSSVRDWISSIFYTPYNIFFNVYFGCIALLLVLGTPLLRKQLLKEKHAVVLFFFLLYLVHQMIIPYKSERFFIFVLPVIAIYAAAVGVHLFKQGTFARVALFALVGASLILLIMNVVTYSTWYTQDETNVAIDRYIDEHNIPGPIITTDPRYAAYSGARYIPAYDILNKQGLYVNDWEANVSAHGAIYVPALVPCYSQDHTCMAHKQALEERLATEFTAKAEFTYNNANVTVYTK